MATLARRTMGGTALGSIVATVAPILVMTIATFMILTQLMIAQQIVIITYAAILGAVALGTALAFGLGGREVARDLLQNAYRTGQERKDELKRDLDRGFSAGGRRPSTPARGWRARTPRVATGYEPTASPASRPHHER
jgi:hypothetical protein